MSSDTATLIQKPKTSGNKSKATTVPSGNPRSEIGIESLRGHVFLFGVIWQQERFIRSKKAPAMYLGTTSDCGKMLYNAIIKGEEPEFKEPEDRDKDVRNYEILFKKNLEKEEKYLMEKSKAFRLIMGQCSSAMRNKLESLSECPGLEENDNIIGLLSKMNELVYSTGNVQYEFWVMQSVITKLVTLCQEPKESLNNYYNRFNGQLESTEKVWGPLIPSMMKGKALTDQDKARDKFLACLFLNGVDRERFQQVVNNLNNDFIRRKISYPEDAAGMLHLLSNHRGNTGGPSKQLEALQDGVISTSFTQTGATARNKQNRKCNYCGVFGHLEETCWKMLLDLPRPPVCWVGRVLCQDPQS
jgi:hypothetical protein